MNTRTQTIQDHFTSGDLKLGLRSLIDLITDTRSIAMYRLGIQFCELFYIPNQETHLIQQEATALLAKLDSHS